ncbi:APC family permease [Spirosoma sp. KUDC1026]|uniref:APC family permease n=1 Tax=Spirosoma sp. KUDC1026 TaxID=2745947 RepID=UPI00159BEFB3|nr:APC family permease [Spirosoma sp. KUDC1026]QKZ11161.1 APC family permease [Spirosoma sp. KUDC1026]
MEKHAKLSELPATAICGNDISSSCLYVSALSLLYAGQYAWISLLLVGGTLFLFRKIYGEVVGALPLNGGAYNVLLNSANKSMASLAACLTILSYVATSVISANEAIHYAAIFSPSLPIILGTIGLLLLFFLLNLLGLKESSKAAVVIFIIHLATLSILCLVCGWHLITEGTGQFRLNFTLKSEQSIPFQLFAGFSAAMLGISGFESSANYVEEQDRGVFPKTLRNMWIIVTIFNPLIAILALGLIPLDNVQNYQQSLLAFMGERSGGHWLSWLVSFDAVLVLSGAVLTSFVGVSGLIKRMTLDRIFPQFLLKENNRQAPYYILLVFFVLCVAVLLSTGGELQALAGVYTISFLSVMGLFGIGNLLLKLRRKRLPRPQRATSGSVFLALIAVGAALAGNVMFNPQYVLVFFEYFIPTFLVALIMMDRTLLLSGLLSIILYLFRPLKRGIERFTRWTNETIKKINDQEFVFFSKGDDIASLNRVMIYIQDNEETNRLRIVTIENEHFQAPEHLHRDIEALDRAYPEIDVTYERIQGSFGPELIGELSAKWQIPTNFMFIGSPGQRFQYRVEQLCGVRLII